MSDTNGPQQKEKAGKVRRKPERESVLQHTFAAARHSTDNSLWDRNQQDETLLQRQCACGAHTIGGGTCDTCRRKDESSIFQRTAITTLPNKASLNAPVEPYTFPKSGRPYDFSQIPAHTNRQAQPIIQPKLMVNALSEAQQIHSSQSVQRNIIQRKRVPTNFGVFETTSFAEADGRGVEITLKFHPNESKVDAKKLALSQSVKTTNTAGAAYAIDPNQAGRMVGSGKSGAGYYTDVISTTDNPLYGQDNYLGAGKDLKDTPQSANTTAAPTQLGVNTNYELGHCYKEKPTDAKKKKHPAGLWDKPQGGKKKGESKVFETTALAIEGTDKDKYYGSVKWGYKMEGTNAAPTVTKMDIELASKGTPTANFIEPAKLWNASKTRGTLQVTADPEATVLKGDASGTEKLAKNTKLKQRQTVMWGTDPAVQAEVLKADGTGSGKIVYIKNSDVRDMGDGAANKKLPT